MSQSRDTSKAQGDAGVFGSDFKRNLKVFGFRRCTRFAAAGKLTQPNAGFDEGSDTSSGTGSNKAYDVVIDVDALTHCRPSA